MTGTLTLVATPIGNLGDLSPRAIEALADGKLVGAILWNPLVVLGSMAFVIGGLIAPIWNRCVGCLPDLRGLVSLRVGLVAALVVNWVYLWMRGV